MVPPAAFDPRVILDAVQAAIVVVGADARVAMWNRGAEQVYLYSAADAMGRSLADLIVVPDEVDRIRDVVSAVAQGHAWSGEITLRRSDGTTFPAAVTLTPILDAGGNVEGIVTHSVDVTARRGAEEALRETSDLLHSIMRSVPVVLFGTDREGILTLSEGRGLEALGLAPGQVVGESVLERYGRLTYTACGEPGPIALTAILDRVLQGASFQCTTAAGQLEYDVWFAPRRSSGGSITGMVGVAVDVSGRKQLEEQLHQARKMEAVGLLAGGVAHDFNNMLTAILGYAELLTSELTDSAHRRDAEEIGRAASRAASLTNQLLAFTRRQRGELSPLDVNEVVRALEPRLLAVAGEGVRVSLDLSAEPAGVLGDRARIDEILLDLAANARDAMPNGGALVVRTRLLDRAGVAGGDGGRYVALDVGDTGDGMDSATASRVFEPFFTTRLRGRSTGLGLATVYAIVRQHDGAVWVDSTPRTGTTFHIRLPFHDITQGATSPGPGEREGRAATILLVEDEDGVRGLVESVLVRAGYKVLPAAGAEAAARLVAQTSQPVDLVLSDILMPGLNGPEMLRELRRIRPGLRVLFMSGYAKVARDHSEPHIAKPFTGSELVRRVSELIE